LVLIHHALTALGWLSASYEIPGWIRVPRFPKIGCLTAGTGLRCLGFLSSRGAATFSPNGRAWLERRKKPHQSLHYDWSHCVTIRHDAATATGWLGRHLRWLVGCLSASACLGACMAERHACLSLSRPWRISMEGPVVFHGKPPIHQTFDGDRRRGL